MPAERNGPVGHRVRDRDTEFVYSVDEVFHSQQIRIIRTLVAAVAQ
jgi:hypothetical protein